MPTFRRLTTLATLAPVLGVSALAVSGCGATDPESLGASGAEIVKCAAGPTVKGIDISEWQTNVDFAKVKADGNEFVLTRVSDGANYMDWTFDGNWAAIKANGMVRGAYQYFRTNQDPVAQANVVVNKVGKLGPGDLPVMLDLESSSGESASFIASRIQTWIDRVTTGTGKAPIVYTMAGFWNSNVNSSSFGHLPLSVASWYASCPTLPSGWSDWKIWQTSEVGKVSGISGNVDLDLFNGSLADLKAFAGTTAAPNVKTAPQIGGNNAITVVNWAEDQHVEAWVKSSDGALYHTWAFNDSDWAALQRSADDVSCGSSAVFWQKDPGYAEVFTPTSSGDVTHSWFKDGWIGPVDFGGKNLTQLSTLLWPDGRVEVFALGSDRAIWHNWMDKSERWSGWYSFGGEFATGATAIVWGDGHPELFATGTDGAAWHLWFDPATEKWSDWQSDLGGNLSSRPVPIRWDDGRVELFARSKDGYLHHAWYGQGKWYPMQRLSDVPIQGEPSAIVNPKGNGGPAGPQIFARDADGKLVTITWQADANAWVDFTSLLQDRTLGSDPFAWVRGDGTAVLFAIDGAGKLVRSSRGADGNFNAWSDVAGPTLDACVATPVADGNTRAPDTGESTEPEDNAGATPPDPPAAAADDSSSSRASAADSSSNGSGCQISTSAQSSGWGFMLALAGLAAFARRSRRS